MAAAPPTHRLPNSARLAPDAPRLGDADDSHTLRLTVVLRPAEPIQPQRHGPGRYLSREEYRTRHATADAAMRRVQDFALSHGMTILSADPAHNVIRLSGTIGQARAAFSPEGLGIYHIDGRRVLARHGHLHVPAAMADDVVAIMGFDQRPVARPHFRVHAAGAAGISYTPTQIGKRYGFPAGPEGSGQTIALIELGGGYENTQLAAWFSAAGIKRTGTVTAIGVDGASNAPTGDPSGADGEVQLDIEVCGALAPAANIAVYFAPNQGSGFLDAIVAAIHDTQHSPSVISISWGGPESSWAAQDIAAMDQALQSAGALGITVCVACGDQGATDGASTGSLTVDFPASSPNALACGGTSLPPKGPETVWNDLSTGGGATGGGFSAHFAKPAYQAAITATGRGLPDVSADADPATGYAIAIDGQPAVIGGTSAVAPLWAALIALANEHNASRAGLPQTVFYASPQGFSDITTGNNGGYTAAPGWDPCTGLGSPLAASVIALLAPPAS